MACRPRCDPANEAISSQLKNFELEFFGQVTKTCVNGQVVWNLPCNLASGMVCYPRLPNEGVACYILRLFSLFGLVASGEWDVNVQYCERAFVTFDGQGYVALVINQAQQPDLNPAVWQLYIEKGADGVNIPSPLTTKGDIWGYSNVNDRIPVGPNNTVLIADSAEALGVRWGNVISVNSASSLGTGEPVYAATVGNDFQFKSLVAGMNVTMTSDANEITINAALPPGSLTEYFESTPQTMTPAALLVLPHGMTGMPLLLQGRLICVNADLGYAPGDEVIISITDNNGFDVNGGVACYPDATNINIRFGSAAATYYLLNKGTGVSSTITNANWTMVVRAWR